MNYGLFLEGKQNHDLILIPFTLFVFRYIEYIVSYMYCRCSGLLLTAYIESIIPSTQMFVLLAGVGCDPGCLGVYC